ncbi:MAG TPA: GNAT family N-acetyltransferase [Pyrinomonadaceae bacterium]|jgi:RimJ/RimL family protein N-acetyltransferase|nr:GNAT family N-acetyltransferase [Pyrinomonadaceae bacterium]
MALANPLRLKLADGSPCLVRAAQPGDARRLIDHYNTVAGESPYMDYAGGEFYLSKRTERQVINLLRAADNSLSLVAVISGEIVGVLQVHGQMAPRMRHAGWLGITVARDFWGSGVGRGLMDWGVRWAEESVLMRKLNLLTHAENARAIAFFKKFGFAEEGRLSRMLFSEGSFHDAVCMGRAV